MTDKWSHGWINYHNVHSLFVHTSHNGRRLLSLFEPFFSNNYLCVWLYLKKTAGTWFPAGQRGEVMKRRLQKSSFWNTSLRGRLLEAPGENATIVFLHTDARCFSTRHFGKRACGSTELPKLILIPRVTAMTAKSTETVQIVTKESEKRKRSLDIKTREVRLLASACQVWWIFQTKTSKRQIFYH